MRLLILPFLLLTLIFRIQAQDGFDIYLTFIGGDEDSGYLFAEPWNITSNPGYDNQPSFSEDGSILIYSSFRDGKQSDVYGYYVPNGPEVQLINSVESEFSPEFMPNGKISTVRVEQDDAQRLWSLKPGKSRGKPILRNIYDVGYYSSLGNNLYALFVLPEPFTLRLAQTKGNAPLVLDRNIGRSIKAIPGKSAFVYISKKDANKWMIKSYDYEKKTFKLITEIAAGPEDLAWGPDNNLYLAKGGKVYYFDFEETEKWYLLYDFSVFGIGDIYRITFSADGNWMAFVVAE